MRALIMMWMTIVLIGMIATNCGYCQQAVNQKSPICNVAKIAKTCGAKEIVSLIEQYLPRVIVALFSGDYSHLLSQLVTEIGADGQTVISCAVQVADTNTAPPPGSAVPPYLQTLHEHATSWLTAHPTACAKPEPSPHVQGLIYMLAMLAR